MLHSYVKFHKEKNVCKYFLVMFENINLKIQKFTGSVKPMLTFKRKNYGKIGKKCFKNSNMLTKCSTFFKIIFSNPAF